MSTETLTIAPPPTTRPEPDPWRYGWRYVNEQQPDGNWRLKQVPLTEEDVLHPQEEDFIVQTAAHNQDCRYLEDVALLRLAGRLGFVVLHDCRIDWGIAGLGAHGPDIAVFENVGAWDVQAGTFYVARLGARPLLIIEATSPSTRNADLDAKVLEYFRAGVPLYVIVDRRVDGNRASLHLLGYEATPRGYVRMALNEQGRLWLEPLRLWLGVDGDQVACFDEQGKRLATYTEVALRLESEVQRAEAEGQRAAAAEATAKAEGQRAEAEAQRAAAAEATVRAEAEARLQLEAKVRELEARLNAPLQPGQ